MTEAAKTKRKSVAELRQELADTQAKLNKFVTLKGTERVHRSYTVAEKLIAIGKVAAGERACDVAAKLSIAPSALSRWAKQAGDALVDRRGRKD